jgi:hypothetical protein
LPSSPSSPFAAVALAIAGEFISFYFPHLHSGSRTLDLLLLFQLHVVQIFSPGSFFFCEPLCLCETYYLLLLAVVPVNHDEVDEEVFVPGSSLLAFFLHLVIVLVVVMIVRSRRG